MASRTMRRLLVAVALVNGILASGINRGIRRRAGLAPCWVALK